MPAQHGHKCEYVDGHLNDIGGARGYGGLGRGRRTVRSGQEYSITSSSNYSSTTERKKTARSPCLGPKRDLGPMRFSGKEEAMPRDTDLSHSTSARIAIAGHTSVCWADDEV